MSSRAIKPKREPVATSAGWQGFGERAPSILRDDTPQLPRYIAVFSLMLITLGGAAVVAAAKEWRYLIAGGWGFLLLSTGVAGLLYHAFYEVEFQFRRLYGFLGGFGLFAVAVLLRLLPVKGVAGGAFLPYGGLALLVSLGFLLCFIRNETDSTIRTYACYLLRLGALANALVGFVGSMMSESFMLQTGVVHLFFGLMFAVGYVGTMGLATPQGLWGGRFIGVIGAALFLVALGRSVLPYLLFRMGIGEGARINWFLPSGLVLCYLGTEYLLMYLGIASDSKVVVLTRRELGSFFCSPIAYIVLIGMAAVGWLNYVQFLYRIFEATDSPRGGGAMMEPIVQSFFVSFIALIPLIFLVPIITMRALSEEKRTGTIEMLLTAPVNEWHVVLSKFFAGLRIFMLCWYTWGIFFIGMRVEGGQDFDYRPIITFLVALLCMGSGFVAMGLFFSSVTKHQVLAAVFTFVVMFGLTISFILVLNFPDLTSLSTVVSYISYVDLWISSARGTITPRLLVLNLSLAAFWLYLSTKVLEARKWS